jgi:opacity protein-like surface antigen
MTSGDFIEKGHIMKYMPAIAAATLVAITAAAAAHADDGFYIGGLVGGVSNSDEDFDAGVDLSVFAGYDFGRIGGAGSLRAEVQVSGRASEPHGSGADNGTYSEDAMFLNVFHDFDMQENAVWIPYIGVGVGRGRIEYNDYRTGATSMVDGSDTVWGAQAILGLGYQLTNDLRVFADYRYRDWQDTKLTDASGARVSIDNASSGINIGAAYTF